MDYETRFSSFPLWFSITCSKSSLWPWLLGFHHHVYVVIFNITYIGSLKLSFSDSCAVFTLGIERSIRWAGWWGWYTTWWAQEHDEYVTDRISEHSWSKGYGAIYTPSYYSVYVQLVDWRCIVWRILGPWTCTGWVLKPLLEWVHGNLGKSVQGSIKEP